MNRFTNKQYIIDIIIKTLQVAKITHHHKIKCEIHYAEDSFLTLPIQPIIRNGCASFCDEKIRIPFSEEVTIVFKFVMQNKKQALMGHYQIQVQKMLKDKLFHFKIKDKLQNYEAQVDFQVKIIDKQLLNQTENNQSQIQAEDIIQDKDKSVISHQIHKIKPLKFRGSPTEIETPRNLRRTINVVPFAPEQFSKVVREAEDIIKKHQIFSQRNQILSTYKRDRKGLLKTQKIESLQNRLEQSRKNLFIRNISVYILASVIAFIVGLQM